MRWGVLFILLTNICHSASSQFYDYIYDLDKRLLIKKDHLLQITENIKLKKFQFWMSDTAEAIYYPWFNLIFLKRDYLKEDSFGYRLKNYDEFHTYQQSSFFYKSSTIFHELHHGDYEVYIKENDHLEIAKLLNKSLPIWFKRNYPRVNAKTATHELFGYTAGEIISVLQDQILNEMIRHGVFRDRPKCFGPVGLKKIAKKLGLDKKINYKEPSQNISYKNKYIPKHIFIKGNDIDVSNIPKKYKKILLNYFIKTYDLPQNNFELIRKLNNSNFYFQKLKTCYLGL